MSDTNPNALSDPSSPPPPEREQEDNRQFIDALDEVVYLRDLVTRLRAERDALLKSVDAAESVLEEAGRPEGEWLATGIREAVAAARREVWAQAEQVVEQMPKIYGDGDHAWLVRSDVLAALRAAQEPKP